MYGPDFEVSQRNLFKYFVKSLGCRLFESNHPIPQDLIELIPHNHFATALKITFAVNEDILLLPSSDRDSFIGKGELLVYRSEEHPDVINSYSWNEKTSWFTTFYWYNLYPDGSCGSAWIANSQHVYLGSFAPLPQDARMALLAKLAESG